MPSTFIALFMTIRITQNLLPTSSLITYVRGHYKNYGQFFQLNDTKKNCN